MYHESLANPPPFPLPLPCGPGAGGSAIDMEPVPPWECSARATARNVVNASAVNFMIAKCQG
jgi:hypothetical protein